MVKKAMLFVLWSGLLLAGVWWTVARSGAEVRWGGEWPEGIRVTGESTERVLTAKGQKPSAGDWARAEERARWKAYYHAQLRAAERLGDLRLAGRTSIRKLALEDQTLEAVYRGTVSAAAEVAGAGSIERLGDVVRATTAVAIPAERLTTLRGAILAALHSGRISLGSGVASKPFPAGTGTPSAPAFGPEKDLPAGTAPATESRGSQLPDSEARSASGEGVSAKGGPSPKPEDALGMGGRPPSTGAVIEVVGDLAAVGATPTLYDAAGTEVGSVFDLPSDRLAAGLPIARSADSEGARKFVGEQPRQFRARVSGGDLFLEERLDRDEILLFREWLRSAKIVVVLDAKEA